jgi:transposase
VYGDYLRELTDIRERTSGSWEHKWAFDRLYEYVEYKIETYGLCVEQVNPKNMSRRCSERGFTHPETRDSGDFECMNCGYQNDTDYSAAKNISL